MENQCAVDLVRLGETLNHTQSWFNNNIKQNKKGEIVLPKIDSDYFVDLAEATRIASQSCKINLEPVHAIVMQILQFRGTDKYDRKEVGAITSLDDTVYEIIGAEPTHEWL